MLVNGDRLGEPNEAFFVHNYIAKTGTPTFAPGQTMKTITIQVKGDSKREANETL